MPIRKNSILGIVGIRSGSQGVKDKNIKMLAGKPLIGWVLDAAKKSKYINRLIVSTDSSKYARIAEKFGAEIPFLRPKKFALKNSPDIVYVKHLLQWLKKKENYTPDIFIRMMATVPMQSAKDLDTIVKHLIVNKKIDSSVVISEARQHPMKALKVKNRKLVSYIGHSGKKVGKAVSRHVFDKAYFRANAIASRTQSIINTDSLTGQNVKYHVIPQIRAIDIDTDLDFKIIDMIMKKKLYIKE